MDYWIEQIGPGVARLPVDRRNEDRAIDAVVQLNLGEEETRDLLRTVPAVYHTQIEEVLVAALADALREWTGGAELLIEMEGHGREDLFEDVDLTRTLGWFTTIYPLRIDLTGASGPGEVITTVKEQMRSVKRKGIDYGLLRYGRDDATLREILKRGEQPEIRFNYLGQFDHLLEPDGAFRGAAESTGDEHPHGWRMFKKLEVMGQVSGGALQIVIGFGEGMFSRATVERLAESYIEHLNRIIRHCKEPDAGGYTPSDFPLADLDSDELDKVFEVVTADN
jgi:non-ribosomal peptide synthase protein (TIGR01720 family)